MCISLIIQSDLLGVHYSRSSLGRCSRMVTRPLNSDVVRRRRYSRRLDFACMAWPNVSTGRRCVPVACSSLKISKANPQSRVCSKWHRSRKKSGLYLLGCTSKLAQHVLVKDSVGEVSERNLLLEACMDEEQTAWAALYLTQNIQKKLLFFGTRIERKGHHAISGILPSLCTSIESATES